MDRDAILNVIMMGIVLVGLIAYGSVVARYDTLSDEQRGASIRLRLVPQSLSGWRKTLEFVLFARPVDTRLGAALWTYRLAAAIVTVLVLTEIGLR